ncbi:MAG TPA: class II D-tagatose-bisphosphate aldolase, non-catalytic subunit, partial [Spirochaetia bacterium]
APGASRAGTAAEAPVYVIGTEVPVPGGETARAGLAPTPTSAADFVGTVETHRGLFHEAGLDDAWRRVIAVVVQPGVEFDSLTVHRYERSAAVGLTAALGSAPGLFFEAHSTDYQPTAALRELVEDGFAVLKVGPELTFTLREQLFGLEEIEAEIAAAPARSLPSARSRLRETVLAAMNADPRSWKGYYPEDARLAYCMTYAYSDRMRYYWDAPEVARAVETLFANLGGGELSLPLVSQHVPHIPPAADIPPGGSMARELVLRGIEGQLERYLVACGSSALAARR